MSEQDSWDPSAYEFDPRPADQAGKFSGERVAVIRTSDRILFKKCRRRWGWNSHLRENLGPKEHAMPLWFGTGFHFALEDMHGDAKFSSASDAFMAYAEATRIMSERSKGTFKLPADWKESLDLARGMLDYYQNEWLATRSPLQTFIFNGVPQTEVNFRVDIPFDATKWGYDRVVYSGTIDRVAIDEQGQIWIVEYKTAKQIQTLHFALDPQVTSYCWAGMQLYGQPITGVIYQQHRKDIPQDPKILANGKLSTAKTLLTSAPRYRKALKDLYGEVKFAPTANIEFLNAITAKEDMDQDKYIVRSRIQRNVAQCEAEGVKILMEVEEMLNPDLPLYPNPTRDCTFMCSFNGPCHSMDDGSDWKYELDILMTQRDPNYDSWRKYLVW